MRIVNTYGQTQDLETIRPTIQASNIYNVLDDLYEFTIGNGRGRIVVASYGSDVSFKPKDRITYPNNTLLSKYQKILYRGNSNQFSTEVLYSGLWYIRIFEYNGYASNEKYLIDPDNSISIMIERGEFILTENGIDFILLENGTNKILLE